MHGPEEVAFTNTLFEKVEEALNAANENNLELLENLLIVLEKPYNNQDKIINFKSPAPLGNKEYQTFCGT